MKSFVFLSFLMMGMAAFAQSIQVLDPIQSQLTSYTSSEFEGVIPFWVIEGRVYHAFETRRLVVEEGKTACVSWLMNFSDDKTITKEDLQNSLLQKMKTIPHWKSVNQRPIYVDPNTDFALSFICIARDANGRPQDIDSTNYSLVFPGIYQFL